MYGTMEASGTNRQPLLPASGGQIPARNRRDGMARAPSARNGPVLSLVMDKSHQKKRHSQVADVSNLELTEDQSHAQPRPKSCVYTMLNPRSDALQAVVYKWFIAIVILSVS
jgi:hypothetical protein